jgi:hypothetical protein
LESNAAQRTRLLAEAVLRLSAWRLPISDIYKKEQADENIV